MKRYVLSPRAQADIEEIWEYTANRWSSGQAESYVREIQSAIDDVAKDPFRGRRCDDIRAGYSKHAVGSHMLFYRLTASGIGVVRILH